MYRVYVLTDRQVDGDGILAALDAEGIGYDVSRGLDLDGLRNGNAELAPDAVLLDIESLSAQSAESIATRCRQLGLPVVAIVSAEHPMAYDPSLNFDDFIMQPLRSGELPMRLGQAIQRTSGSRSKHVLRVGVLHIDTERYEVRLAGERVVLTYKEYQLLVLLASNPGKVYTRDSLLSQVWGYDYFGGTRTVDVHVRRLRSKIEDASHSFIETIWNVGYRFNARP